MRWTNRSRERNAGRPVPFANVEGKANISCAEEPLRREDLLAILWDRYSSLRIMRYAAAICRDLLGCNINGLFLT